MPRRANDPDLLRAQARNGRQGEDAWRAAQQQLAGQRQAAVRQAMQEAALRGAPAGAISQLRGQVAAPYNQAIRSTTQLGANFAADMSARRGRMYDYNQAVLAARELIPVQIQQAVAPIRAQNRFQLQSLRQEGANRIGEIEAQTALQLAQMQAAERLRQMEEEAERRKAASDLPTLTQSEMAAALEGDAAAILAQAQAQAQQIAERNQTAIREEPEVVAAAGRATGAGLAAMYGGAVYDYPERQDMGQLGRGFAAMYGGAEAMRPRPSAPPPRPSEFAQGPPQGPTMFAQGPPQGPTLSPFVQGPPQGPPPARPPADMQQLGTGFATMFGGARAAPTPAVQPGALGPNTPLSQALQQLLGGANQATGQYREATAPYYSQQTGYLTEPQLSRLAGRQGDVLAPLIQAAYQDPISGPREIAEIVGGQPTGGLEVLPSATESFRQAMEVAATRLAEQFGITMPEVQLGMRENMGQTLANYEALQRGEASIPEQIEDFRAQAEELAKQQQEAYEDRLAEQRRAEEEAESDYRWGLGEARRQASEAAGGKAAQDRADREAIEQRYKTELAQVGINWKGSMGPLEVVYLQVFTDPKEGTIRPEFQGALNQVNDWLEENAETWGWDIEKALDESKIFDANTRRLIKAALG